MKKHLLFFWALTVLLMPGVQSCDDSSEGGSAPAELTVTPNPLTVGADGGPQSYPASLKTRTAGASELRRAGRHGFIRSIVRQRAKFFSMSMPIPITIFAREK